MRLLFHHRNGVSDDVRSPTKEMVGRLQMSFSLRQIRYFIAAAETGQITLAAAELNVSQSAVTMAIKNLEESLDTTLFERHSYGIALTFEGRQFLFRAKDIIAAVDEAARFPRCRRDEIRGSLRLVLTYTVAGYYFPALLARFRRDFPNVSLTIQESSRSEIERGLFSEEFDLAIMLTSNLSNQNDLTHMTLLSSNRRLWVCGDHRFLGMDSVSIADVATEPYIMLTVDEAEDTAQRYWSHTGYQPNVVFRTSSVEAVRSLVAHGVGVTILSDIVYRPWSLEGRRIIVRPLSISVPSMNLGLTWKARTELSPAANAFKEFLLFASNPSPSSGDY